jgi:hypothetical protein
MAPHSKNLAWAGEKDAGKAALLGTCGAVVFKKGKKALLPKETLWETLDFCRRL